MNSEREVPPSFDGGRVVASRKAPRLDDGGAAIDEDMCMEILLLLPIKLVTKFQTVCKQWLSLISSNHFRRLHALRHHQPPPYVILTTLELSLCHFNPNTKPTMMIPFSINNIPRDSKTIFPTTFSSCNGLLMLHWNPNYCHVYNPITRQSRKICFCRTDSYSCVMMLHLVFDPSKSIHYKVFCMRRPKGALLPRRSYTQTYKMEVFDSEKGTWKTCMDPITLSSMLGFTYSVYCNNKIYVIDYTHDGSLCCIDIDKKVVRFLTSPTHRMPQGVTKAEAIQEWNGCLYYSTVLYSDYAGHWAFLWEKLEEEDKWLLKHQDRVPLPVGCSDAMQLRFIAQTSTLLILVPARKIMAYSFIEKSCNELLDDSCLQIPCDIGSIHLFHQTLAPV